MFEGGAEAADGLNRFKGLNAFLLADRFAEKRSQEVNVIEEQSLHFRKAANAGVERINHRNSTGERRQPAEGKKTEKRVFAQELIAWLPWIRPALRTGCMTRNLRANCDVSLKRLGAAIEIDSVLPELYTSGYIVTPQ
jgi:hypothetical protein